MDLAREILEESRRVAQPPGTGWLARVPSEHHAAIAQVRDEWLRSGGSASGVTATKLAKIIVEKLSAREIKTPGYRQVQRWLTARD